MKTDYTDIKFQDNGNTSGDYPPQRGNYKMPEVF